MNPKQRDRREESECRKDIGYIRGEIGEINERCFSGSIGRGLRTGLTDSPKNLRGSEWVEDFRAVPVD